MFVDELEIFTDVILPVFQIVGWIYFPQLEIPHVIIYYRLL